MSDFKLYKTILNSLVDEKTVQFLKNDDNRSAARKISDDVEQFLKESE